MSRFLTVALFTSLFLNPAAFAEGTKSLDAGKFVAPGSVQSGQNSAGKASPDAMPGPANPASGPTATGERRPIAPVNGECPDNYYCNVASTPVCRPFQASFEISGPGRCSNVQRFCQSYRDIKAKGGTLDDSDHGKYQRYCM